MGRVWGGNLRDCPDTDIVAWVDLNEEAVARAVDEAGVTGVLATDDLDKAIAETKPDFVVDVTIPAAHHAVTLKALRAGLPVLGEKPMAESMQQAREMVAASEKAGKLYMVSQNRRYKAQIRAYKKLIQDNIGALGILNSDFYIGAHFGGFRDQMEHPLILDMAIHTFDQARFISGADPVAVYCDEFNPSWSWYKGDVCATALFEMSEGLRYTYRGSWCAEGRHTSWESDWRAVGTHGSATWNGGEEILAEVAVENKGFHSTSETRTEAPDADMRENIAGSLRGFLHALRTGETPLGECHDNIKSLAMVFGCVESSANQQRILISDLLR